MCRERWISHLDPSLKKNYWENREDIILLSEYLLHSTKWLKISLKLPGRNVHCVKNRFYSLMNQNGISTRNPNMLKEIIKLLDCLKQKSNKKIKSDKKIDQVPNLYYTGIAGNQQNNYFLAPIYSNLSKKIFLILFRLFLR